MVIDEAEAASGCARERESRSSVESIVPNPNFQRELRGDDVLSENGSESLPPGDVNPDSPLSIPLPDSTPPPSVREGPSLEDEDTHELSSDEIGKEDETMEPDKEKDEYDPCHPLTSSEDEDVPPPQTQPLNTTTMNTLSPQKPKPAPAPPPVEVSTIPLPGDEYRRPTIQFSIPSRHRIFSMGSLIRRNKGVMKKEAKAGGSISFQSEMSKAFARKLDDSGSSGSAEPEKLSLVAEIFGSDEDEEEEETGAAHTNELETHVHVPVVTLPSLVVENPVPEPPPVVESTTEGLEGSKWRKIVEDEPVVTSIVPPKCLPVETPIEADQDDDVVVIGEVRSPPEVQIIETPPPEPEDELGRELLSSRDRRQHKKSTEPSTTKSSDEKSPTLKENTHAGSIDSLSDSENEFERQRLREKRLNAKKKDEERRRDRRSKSPKKDKDNKRTQKRRRSLSAESNCEEGEILDVPDKKKKKTKKSKKSKKRRRGTRSRSSSSSEDGVSFSEKKIPEEAHGQITEEDDGAEDVHWKKPSKSTKERNYR